MKLSNFTLGRIGLHFYSLSRKLNNLISTAAVHLCNSKPASVSVDESSTPDKIKGSSLVWLSKIHHTGHQGTFTHLGYPGHDGCHAVNFHTPRTPRNLHTPGIPRTWWTSWYLQTPRNLWFTYLVYQGHTMYGAIGGIRIPCMCSAIVERAMNIILLNLNTSKKKKISSLYARWKILTTKSRITR